MAAEDTRLTTVEAPHAPAGTGCSWYVEGDVALRDGAGPTTFRVRLPAGG